MVLAVSPRWAAFVARAAPPAGGVHVPEAVPRGPRRGRGALAVLDPSRVSRGRRQCARAGTPVRARCALHPHRVHSPTLPRAPRETALWPQSAPLLAYLADLFPPQF